MPSSFRPIAFVLIAITCATSGTIARAAEATEQAPFAVIDEAWQDAARQREVPVRIYLPADKSRPAPAILVSHGLGDWKGSMAYACKAWAAEGFVVVTLEHAGSDRRIWDNVKRGQELSRLSKAASVENFVLRCDDVKFALDELARRTADEQGKLAGRIDLEHIGLAGHSFGALTAQAIIGERFEPVANQPLNFADARIKAAIIMSPGIEGALANSDAAFGDIRVPTFHFTGTVDVATGLGITIASRRRVPFDHSNQSDRYLVTFDRGDHIVFSGTRPKWINEARYDHIQAAVAKLSTQFWLATLRDDAAARAKLMDADAAGLDKADRLEHRGPSAAPSTTRPTQ